MHEGEKVEHYHCDGELEGDREGDDSMGDLLGENVRVAL